MKFPACTDCFFFLAASGMQRYGECRRLPPTLSLLPNGKPSTALFPLVSGNGYCGGFQSTFNGQVKS